MLQVRARMKEYEVYHKVNGEWKVVNYYDTCQEAVNAAINIRGSVQVRMFSGRILFSYN